MNAEANFKMDTQPKQAKWYVVKHKKKTKIWIKDCIGVYELNGWSILQRDMAQAFVCFVLLFWVSASNTRVKKFDCCDFSYKKVNI